MHRPPSALPAGLTLATEPYGGDGPRWVVARAEAELVARVRLPRRRRAGPHRGHVRPSGRGLRGGPPRRCRRTARRRGRGPRRRPGRRRDPAPLGRPRLPGAGHRPGAHGRRGGRGPRPGPGRAAARHRRPPARGGGPLRATGWEEVPIGGAEHVRFAKALSSTTGGVPSRSSARSSRRPRPDLTRVRHQIGVMSPVATTFLIPDNHIGRATVSSVAVAYEVQQMGGRAIACLNARDRNLLGFRRDLLTAAAYGVDQFLFVYGDEPLAGARTSELTVRTMLAEGALVLGGSGRRHADALRRGGGTAAAAGVEAGGRLPLRADRVLPRRPAGLAGVGRRRRPRLRRRPRRAQRRHRTQPDHPRTHGPAGSPAPARGGRAQRRRRRRLRSGRGPSGTRGPSTACT